MKRLLIVGILIALGIIAWLIFCKPVTLTPVPMTPMTKPIETTPAPQTPVAAPEQLTPSPGSSPVLAHHAPRIVSHASAIMRLPSKASAPVPVSVSPVVAPLARPSMPVIPVSSEPMPQEWKGNSDTSIQHAGQIVIHTDEQWVHFWAEHHPDEAAPDVDFAHAMVVGIFLGLRPSDGFQVRIVDVHQAGNKLVVDYQQVDPPPGTFQVGVSAYPYNIKVIPKSPLRVDFHAVTAQYQQATPNGSK